jgi:hypothetical protein
MQSLRDSFATPTSGLDDTVAVYWLERLVTALLVGADSTSLPVSSAGFLSDRRVSVHGSVSRRVSASISQDQFHGD